jgi:hypothetical protein
MLRRKVWQKLAISEALTAGIIKPKIALMTARQ